MVRGLLLLTSLASAMLCTSCISMGVPDLALQSVELVDQAEQPELAGWNVSREEKPYRLLKVSFTSSIDLPRYLAENSYPMGNTAVFCDSSQSREFARASSSSVYQNEVKVEGYTYRAPLQGKAPYTYYSFFNLSRRTNQYYVQGTALPPYDLRQKAVDLCFDLRGGAAPSPFGYKSNIVRIPAALIESAIKNSAN
jgi:hypothetical protein